MAHKKHNLQPDWKNAPSVGDLRQDLREASSDHAQQVAQIERWLDNLNITGYAKMNNGVGKSSIVPKLIRKHAEWRYASLSEPLHSASTLFTTRPVSGEDGPIARQDGKILAHQFENEINKTALIDEAVRTCVDEGTVVYRVGWEYESSTREVEKVVLKNGMAVGKIKDTEEYTSVSRPTVDIVPYHSFILDPNARGDINKAQFAIYKFPTNISKLKAEGYENLEDIDVGSIDTEDTDMASSPRNATYFRLADESRREIIAYEYWGYWDINDDKVLVPIVATFVGNVMIRLKANPFPDRKLPFVITQYLPVREKNWGESDGVLLEDNQKIMGALTRGMLDTLGRSANGQTGVSENALDAPNRLRFERGEDYTFRAGIDVKSAIHHHTYPELSSSGFNLLGMQAAEAESMTGVQTYGDGVQGTQLGETAAGVKGALGAAAKRESGILRRLADGLTEVARKIMLMNSVFLEAEIVERITGEPYIEPVLGLKTTDVRVKIRTAEEDNQLAQDMAFISQTTEDPGLRQLITAEIADLRNMPDLAAKIRSYEPTPDPMALRIQQLEMELLEAKIANEHGKAHNNTSSGILDTAKANTEVAKAANLQADTNLKNLEFVEEETGTKHERDLDLMRTQAEGNMHHETLKHKLTKVDGETSE